VATAGCEQRDAKAQYNLGAMYNNGEGVPEDDAEAVKWYRLAAEQGLASAQSRLGLMYDNGEGVSEDDAEAVKWYRLAAGQGLASARVIKGPSSMRPLTVKAPFPRALASRQAISTASACAISSPVGRKAAFAVST
jgi:TPR repeat protein